MPTNPFKNKWKEFFNSQHKDKPPAEQKEEKSPGNYHTSTSKHFKEYRHVSLNDKIVHDWKLHISLADQGDNIEIAWEKAILPVLKKYGIKDFKIALNPSESQGKVITIYLAYNLELKDRKRMAHFLSEIERGLIATNSRPGQTIAGDAVLDNSKFLHYRNEQGELRDWGDRVDYMYLDDQMAQKVAKQLHTPPHNPYQHEDTFGLERMHLFRKQEFKEEDLNTAFYFRESSVNLLSNYLVNLQNASTESEDTLRDLIQTTISLRETMKRTDSKEEIISLLENAQKKYNAIAEEYNRDLMDKATAKSDTLLTGIISHVSNLQIHTSELEELNPDSEVKYGPGF